MLAHEFKWSEAAGLSLSATPPAADPSLVLAFGPHHLLAGSCFYDTLRAAFPKAILAGCTTAGQFDRRTIEDDTVIGVAAWFETGTVKLATRLVDDPRACEMEGHSLGAALNGHAGLRAVLVLSEGIRINGTSLVEGLKRALPPEVTVAGGLAADGRRFEETLVMADGPARSGLVAAIGFYGAGLTFQSGIGGGWEPFGPRRRITRSQDNILYELDGSPALTLYERYLGEEARDLPASALLFPLRIEDPGQPLTDVVRTVLGIDRERGSLIFAGDVPQDWTAQLMRGSLDRIVSGSVSAARRAAPQGLGDGGFSLLVSCVGRRLLMGQWAFDEVSAASDALDPRQALVGFYSYGEIASLPGSRRAQLHNQTMTIFSVGEQSMK